MMNLYNHLQLLNGVQLYTYKKIDQCNYLLNDKELWFLPDEVFKHTGQHMGILTFH